MRVLIDPAATRRSMATEMVRDVPSLLFGMDILSAGQCAAGNSSAFVPDETIAGDQVCSSDSAPKQEAACADYVPGRGQRIC